MRKLIAGRAPKADRFLDLGFTAKLAAKASG
jgi:hypothetical protein